MGAADCPVREPAQLGRAGDLPDCVSIFAERDVDD
jgi:hypothetical protein